MALVFVGLGSNLGDRRANLLGARRALAMLPETDLIDNALIYETRPQGGPAGQNDFFNSASVLETKLEPPAMLRHLQDVERSLGRRREEEAVRWGPRVIDLDILLWGDQVIEEADLVVPHPRMCERAFALAPLVDLAPDFLHPVRELTLRELLERIDLTDEGIRRIPL